MAYNNYHRDGYVLNEDQLAAFLKDALSRVENSSNAEIETFKQIKKIFKKNVPFSRRNYVAAMLIKNATYGYRGNRYSKAGDSRNEKFSRPKNDRYAKNVPEERPERSERPPRVTIDPAVASTIFISVGKSRAVYPRDLIGLLVSVADLDRSRIGEIRVLSNYSFVQLYTEDCEKVFAALGDYEYRGRKLSVSYSRAKDEKPAYDSHAASSEDTIPSNVTNDAHGDTSYNAEGAKLAAEQSAFAASQTTVAAEEKPYSSTENDGQVKSHFGDGAAY